MLHSSATIQQRWQQFKTRENLQTHQHSHSPQILCKTNSHSSLPSTPLDLIPQKTKDNN